MSDKNVPDKATDLDDDLPTYDGSATSAKDAVKNSEKTSNSVKVSSQDVDDATSADAVEEKPKKSRLFQRAGRAEPKVIKPKPAEPAPALEPEVDTVGSAESTESTERVDAADSTETRAFESPSTAKSSAVADKESLETTAFPSAEPAEVEPAAVAIDEDDEVEERGTTRAEVQPARRGTIDFGLLFVRLALSAYLLVAGASTFFKLGGNEGLSGLENEFGDYTMASALAIGVPTVQLIAGAFLLLGLVTPLAAMFGLIVTGFAAIHGLYASGAGFDVFAWGESVWLGLVLFVIAVALQFTGPGFISLDFNRSWTRRPLATSWVFVVIGIAALVAVWWFGAGVNPLS